MYNLILVIIFSILSSCSNGKSNDANFKIKEEKLSVSSASKNVLFRTSKAILFSNELKLDTFLLEAKGKTLLESIIFFKIINSKNDVIYYRQFRSEDIIGYDFTLPNENADSIALTMTDERKQILIKNKLENFFDLKNFKTPAIPTNLSYDTDTSYPNRYTWELIKKNKSSKSFYFNIYDESVFFITYNPEFREVVEFK